MSEIEKMHENANIKPEYRYDCNLADTIKPVEVFPLCSCSKGEIKDYCTNKQDYRYCKVYKVNKIYPPFTAEKQLELIKWLGFKQPADIKNKQSECCVNKDFAEALAGSINYLWQDLTEAEHNEIRDILKN